MALFDDVESDDVEPTVLLVFPDDVPLAFVWFLSRTILLLTSQHWLEAVPLDPELVPVPCAFAIPATAMSAAPVIAARQILFMVFPLSLTGKNADKSQCGRSNRVPLNSLIALSDVATRGQKRSGARINPLSRGLQSSGEEQKQIHYRGNLYRPTLFAPCPILDGRQLVDAMKKILLATVTILAFAAPSFAIDAGETVGGQAPPKGATSFYLAQDNATMKCQVVNAQPAAGGSMKVIGTAHPTQPSAETALTADKTRIK